MFIQMKAVNVVVIVIIIMIVFQNLNGQTKFIRTASTKTEKFKENKINKLFQNSLHEIVLNFYWKIEGKSEPITIKVSK
jgi:hypothetical protein